MSLARTSFKKRADATSVMIDLMFLLLLTILSIYMAQVAPGVDDLEGSVNDVRTVTIAQATQDEIRVSWGATVDVFQGRPAGMNPAGFAWMTTKTPEGTRKTVSIYFFGSLASGKMRIQCSAEAEFRADPAAGGGKRLVGDDITVVIAREALALVQS